MTLIYAVGHAAQSGDGLNDLPVTHASGRQCLAEKTLVLDAMRALAN